MNGTVKMQHFVVFATLLVVASARWYETPEDIGYPYEREQLSRHARDVQVDPQTGSVSGQYPVGGGQVFGAVQGNEGRFGYKRNIFDNQHGRLDGAAYHARTIGAGGASGAGARLDYTGARGAASLDVNRLSHGPTSVGATGGGSWKLGRNLDATLRGSYHQTFGRGRPDVGVFGSVSGRW